MTEGARELAEKIYNRINQPCDCDDCKADVDKIASEISAFAASAVARERERCAEIVASRMYGADPSADKLTAIVEAIREVKS